MILISPGAFLVVAALLVNALVFFLFGYDKRQAHNNGWRIPEKTLLLSSLAGPFGGLLGMKVFSHKTRKVCFYVIVPFFAVLQVAGAAALVTGIA